MIGDRAEGFVEIVLCHQLRLAKGKRSSSPASGR
jgi:hypothetical protein